MNAFFYWTGVSTWASIALLALWFVGFELLVVGVANSISWHRWSITTSTSFRLRKHWRALVKSFFAKCVKFWGYRKNGDTRYVLQSGAYWRGVGDWSRGL